MPWGRLHDRANGDAKLLALSDAAWRMWGCGLIYCQANLTDGFIPEHALHTFGVRAPSKRRIAAELSTPQVPGKAALWEQTTGGYQVHDYLEWNDSREAVLADRDRSEEGRDDRARRLDAGRRRTAAWRARRCGAPSGDARGDAAGDAGDVSPDAGCDAGDASRDISPPHPPSVPQPLPHVHTHPARARGRIGAGAMAGALLREHLNHAWCGNYRKCVPDFLHGEFVRALGGDPAEADRTLRAFYDRVMAEIPDDKPIGDEPLKFWRAHVAAAFASAAPPRPRRVASRGTTPVDPRKYLGVTRSDADAD